MEAATLPAQMGAQPVYEPVGGGWYKVTSGKHAYWWHEETCKRMWTEPTAEQYRTGGVLRKTSKRPNCSVAKHDRTDARPARSPAKPPKKNASHPRPVVPLELPPLSPQSPRSQLRTKDDTRAGMYSNRHTSVESDTLLKPRLASGPVPRQRRARSTSEAFDVEHLRDLRVQRQRAIELDTYTTAFQIIDLDGSGSVEPSEVLKVLKLMGKQVDDAKFWQVFRDLDLDNSCALEYKEFQTVMDVLARRKGPNAGGTAPVRTVRKSVCLCVPEACENSLVFSP